jgi:hypothetical protein
VKSLIITAISFLTFTVALAWTPLSLPRVETKQVKVYSDTGNVYPKTVEVINQVALQRDLTQIESAIKDDRAVHDSAFGMWGIDTVGANDTTVVTIGTTYESATSYAALTQVELNLNQGLYCTDHTATAFVVRNSNNTTVVFRWITIGRK